MFTNRALVGSKTVAGAYGIRPQWRAERRHRGRQSRILVSSAGSSDHDELEQKVAELRSRSEQLQPRLADLRSEHRKCQGALDDVESIARQFRRWDFVARGGSIGGGGGFSTGGGF